MNATATQRPVKLRLLLACVLLAAAGALTLKLAVERLSRRGAPAGPEGRPEFTGHPWFAATYDLVARAG